MSSLEGQIDDLYRLPLGEFTPARNALAKSLTGATAKQIRALAKPTLVPWAVNQVYWRARATYDRLLKSGERLRAAQIAALEGRAADVRGAGEAHRRAIGDAVAEAERIAAAAGSQPGADAVARMFEALSIAPALPESPGRFTQPLQPAGFEALAGITPAEVKAPDAAGTARQANPVRTDSSAGSARTHARAQGSVPAGPTAAERARERAAAEKARKHEAAMESAKAAVTEAERVEKEARATWEQAHDALLAARRALMELRSSKSEV